MRFPREHADYHPDIIGPLRVIEFSRLGDEVYLDYTGAALYPESLVMDHLWDLRGNVYGNPHSDSPASQRATEIMSTARAAVLRFFNADPDEYTVVFTANATAAMQLVGLSYPFQPDSLFLYTADVHNSALGLRELARDIKCTVGYLPLQSDLRVSDTEAMLTLNSHAGGLFTYPAQCNFSGVHHPLSWINAAHNLGWRVLLDAAAFVPTNPLDLRRFPADYVAVSFYKIFGYPSGIGALIARREALEELQQPWHAGGSTRAASVAGDWYHLAAGADAFEHGTVNYLAAAAVTRGLEYISALGLAQIHDRVQLLTGWTLAELANLHHKGGEPLIRLYGPLGIEQRGAAITFNLLDPSGAPVDERIVAARAREQHISLRTGCFCAPGAAETAFALDPADLVAAGELPADAPMDAYLDTLGMPTGGAIRISYGLASNAADAERFLEFAATFADARPSEDNLPARVHC